MPTGRRLNIMRFPKLYDPTGYLMRHDFFLVTEKIMAIFAKNFLLHIKFFKHKCLNMCKFYG